MRLAKVFGLSVTFVAFAAISDEGAVHSQKNIEAQEKHTTTGTTVSKFETDRANEETSTEAIERAQERFRAEAIKRDPELARNPANRWENQARNR